MTSCPSTRNQGPQPNSSTSGSPTVTVPAHSYGCVEQAHVNEEIPGPENKPGGGITSPGNAASVTKNEEMVVTCFRAIVLALDLRWLLGSFFVTLFERLGQLDEGISQQRDAVNLTPDDHSDMWPCRLNDLGNSFRARFEHLGQLHDLEDAISWQRDAVNLTPDNHPHKSHHLNNLGSSFLARFQRLGQLRDLEEGISWQRDAIDIIPDNHPDRPRFLNNLASSFLTRFKHFSRLHDLEEAVSLQQDAINLTPDDHPDRPCRLDNLGNSLYARFVHLGQLHDLEDAISWQRDAVKITPDNHLCKPHHLNNLGSSLLARFQRLGQLRDLEEGISWQRDAIDLVSDDRHDRPRLLSNLASSFITRFKRLGQLYDLEEGISRRRDAVNLTPENHSDRPSFLNDLGSSLATRFAHLGQLHDLEEAISLQQDAVNLIPGSHPHKPCHLSDLSSSFCARFKHLGQLHDLEEAISLQQDAVNLTPDNHPHRPRHLNSLGVSFIVRFKHLGQLHDLEEGIFWQQDAVNLTPGNHPDRSRHLDSLGSSFLIRFEHLGQQHDLEKGISLHQDAVTLTPDDHLDRCGYLNNLGSSLATRFEHLGQLYDLGEAISRKRDAVNITPDNHPSKPGYLSNLGSSFVTRFRHLGQVYDLDEAISLQQDAVNLAPDNRLDRPYCLSSLGNSFLVRFEHLGQLHDLEEAISRQRDAVNLTPDNHPDKPYHLSNLGSSILIRFQHFKQLDDLDEAISRQQDAVKLTPDSHPHRPARLNNLGNSLHACFEHLGRLHDLEEAISCKWDAVNFTPDNHPDKPRFLNSLGNTLLARFRHLGQLHDIEQAVVLYSNAACTSAGPITARFHASRHWIQCARLLYHSSLLSAYSVAIRLLPQLAWIGLSLGDRYRALTQASDVVREAAAAALASGCPETAIEWLEQGRSIVWGDLFQLRSSYDELSSTHPDHARRLRELSTALEQAGTIQEKNVHSWKDQAYGRDYGTMTPLQREADRYRMLAIERDKLLQNIRTLPGFERFLLHKEFSQLRASARSGPVVVLNAVKTRYDALIVLANVDHVVHVPLPNFSPEKSKEFQSVLKNVIRHTRGVSSDRHGHVVDREGRSTWEVVLAHLWKCVVKPVLDALAISTPGDLSRIFWCPAGLMTFLPIHAAGFYNARSLEPGHKVFDFVVSSYVPTLSILASSFKSESAHGDGLRLLAVRQPVTDGQSKLTGVHDELEHIKRVIRDSPSVRATLVEPSVGTVEEVLELMKETDWVHFACHGVQDGMNPTESGLCLADRRRLRISDIIALSRPRGGLAFLSACHTAKGDEDLSDEAIHVAAGMLFAGYGGVIGTMWAISDSLAPAVAKDVYEQLFQSGSRTPDYREAARALHVAVGRLRERKAAFNEWLPFIHMGL